MLFFSGFPYMITVLAFILIVFSSNEVMFSFVDNLSEILKPVYLFWFLLFVLPHYEIITFIKIISLLTPFLNIKLRLLKIAKRQ